MINPHIIVACALVLAAGCAGAVSKPATPPTPPRSAAEQDFDTANAYAERGDYVRAEQYFVSALRRGYPDTQVITKLMRVCLGGSRLRAALGYAQLYLLHHPDAWAMRHLAAAIHLALEQPEQARRELVAVLRERPAHEAAARLLARLPSPAQEAAP